MKTKKIILGICLFLWMLIIFLFSNQNATISQKTSDGFMSHLIDSFITVSNIPISSSQKEEIIENTSFIVRKTAHFTLYFVLGFLIFLNFEAYSIKRSIVLSIIFCFLYALSDEFHQLFLMGRSCQITDVLLDTTGSSFGIFIFNFIKKNKKILAFKENL